MISLTPDTWHYCNISIYCYFSNMSITMWRSVPGKFLSRQPEQPDVDLEALQWYAKVGMKLNKNFHTNDIIDWMHCLFYYQFDKFSITLQSDPRFMPLLSDSVLPTTLNQFSGLATHASTARAHRSITTVIWWEPVCSIWFVCSPHYMI